MDLVDIKPSKRVRQMKKIQDEGLELFTKKNQDYGDAFAKYGPVGVLMRMNDKISRLQSISKSGIVLVNDEKMRDTLIDLHNYSAMAIMLLDEGKPINGSSEIHEPYRDSDDIIETMSDTDTHKSTYNFDFSPRSIFYYASSAYLVAAAGALSIRYLLSKRL